MQEWMTLVATLVAVAALLSLADWKQVSARMRERLIPVALIVGGLTLAIGYMRLTHPQPSVEAVNGRYTSACCEPVTLNNGMLFTSNLKVPFELRRMKYGLDTSMDRRVEVSQGKIVLSRSTEPGGFLFAEDGRAFTICAERCGPGREFEFKRQ